MALLLRSFVLHFRHPGPILLVLMATVFGLLATNAISFRMELATYLMSASDNPNWTTSQIEVDHKNLLLALEDARSGASELARNLSVAFDIYWSRVDIVYATLKSQNIPPSLRNNLEKAASSRDTLALQFDGLDIRDPTALAGFTAKVRLISPLIRSIVLDSRAYFIADALSSREWDVRLWHRFLAVSQMLVTLMAAAMCYALLLRRKLSDQMGLVQSAAKDLQMVYGASMMAVVVSDLDGKVVLFNAAAEKVFGCNAVDMLGRDIAETMIPPHRLAAHHRAMRQLGESGTELWLSGKPKFTTTLDATGREFPIELTIHANRDANGKTLLIAFVRDVSEQLAYEKNLREARDEACRHAESRSMFLATMSHEMRTPLHGLLASLDLIDEAHQSPETRRLLTIARDCAQRSVAQINDVLDLIQIDELQEPATAFAPAQAVHRIAAELDALARERGNRLQLKVTGARNDQLWLGSAKTFTRVMYNLIGNALKFTEEGSVQIDLSFSHNGASGCRLNVSVQDNGIGIAQAEQAHIFDLFVTSPSNGAGRRQEGTGLGLPIARKGVEKMGGQLCLHSTLGEGSRFYFQIPIAALRASVPPAIELLHRERRQQFDLSCLVVDDNPVNLDLTTQMLRQLGCKVLARDNGLGAVSAAAQMQFDVIFMDLNMPGGISGSEAARQIRELEQINPPRCAKSCIVALTADTTFGSPASLVEHGMDNVLHKPVRIQDLVQFLSLLGTDLNTSDQSGHFSESETGFDELIALMGPLAAKRLLDGLVSDLRAVQAALESQSSAPLTDLLHRAIGSAGIVGLTSLCQTLSKAIKTFRQNGHLGEDISTVFISCDLAIETVQEYSV